MTAVCFATQVCGGHLMEQPDKFGHAPSGWRPRDNARDC
jgi:hypothetical protein